MKKILLTLAGILVVLIVGLLVFARMIGAWHILFPSSHHETVPPEIPAGLEQPAVLVFSKTNAFRHIDGIEAGNVFFRELAARRGWGVFFTENSAVFNDTDLARFAAVVFNSATGDMMSDAQEAAFRRWLEAGGGWVGVHAAGDDSHAGWPWYVETLIGARFTAHTMGPQFQTATVHVEDTTHAAMRGVPAVWEHEEEWYSWDRSPREAGFHILATVDESTYSPRFIFLGMDRDLRMGDHPVIWSREVGQGRALYTALGHRAEAFASPEYRKVLEGALTWAIGIP